MIVAMGLVLFDAGLVALFTIAVLARGVLHLHRLSTHIFSTHRSALVFRVGGKKYALRSPGVVWRIIVGRPVAPSKNGKIFRRSVWARPPKPRLHRVK